LGLAAVIAAGPVPALAAQEDEQAWAAVVATTALGKDVDATMEGHFRFSDGASRLGVLLLRPSVTAKLGDGWSATAGYAFVRSRPRGARTTNEHRAWQQLGYGIWTPEGGPVALTGRTRIEQRFRENADGTGWRLRQQARLKVPLGRARRVGALLWNETFVGLNDTRWGQRSGLDQVRTFAGVSVPVGEGLTLEPGYLNQVVVRPGPNAVNHIGAVNLFARF